MQDSNPPTAPRDLRRMAGWLREQLSRFRPARTAVGLRERGRATLAAGLGVLAVALVGRWWVGDGLGESLWIAAPLGASAVLVFAVPASPLAQPWSVIGGNVLSAFVGCLAATLIGDTALAVAVAVAAAIFVMFACRCLHPPGGATALLAAYMAVTPAFAVFPMLLNSIVLVAAGVVINGLTGRRYPHARPPSEKPSTPASRFSATDLDTALRHYNQVIDVSRTDLEEILQFAEAAAYERNFGHLKCADVMTPDPVTAQFGTPLDEAWATMRKRRIKALPVVDRSNRVVGILTVVDYMRHAGWDTPEGVGDRLRTLLRRDGKLHSDKPETVGQIMAREVRVVSRDRRLSELVPLFSEAGHHHVPVIDEDKRLVGIITQSDLVKALHRASRPAS